MQELARPEAGCLDWYASPVSRVSVRRTPRPYHYRCFNYGLIPYYSHDTRKEDNFGLTLVKRKLAFVRHVVPFTHADPYSILTVTGSGGPSPTLTRAFRLQSSTAQCTVHTLFRKESFLEIGCPAQELKTKGAMAIFRSAEYVQNCLFRSLTNKVGTPH
jgi:hypothetical protein